MITDNKYTDEEKDFAMDSLNGLFDLGLVSDDEYNNIECAIMNMESEDNGI